MRLNKDLVPIIRKDDMDGLATTFLQTYCPEALRQPMPLPVEDIAELQMGIDIDYVNITEDCRTLGMMIFSDGITEIYDKDTGQYINQKVTRGTMLVESDLNDNRGRERFTIAHEMVHWDKHQLRFTTLSYHDKTLAKACRCPKDKVLKAKTPDEWLEWQADNLAAAILMPAEMFRLKTEELKNKYQGKVGKKINDFMWKGFSPAIIKDFIIDDLAETFQVSRQAAQIRCNTLQLAI